MGPCTYILIGLGVVLVILLASWGYRWALDPARKNRAWDWL